MEKTEIPADALAIILSDMVRKKLASGTHQTTILVALQEVMDFVHTIVDQLEVSGQSPAVSCTSGCSFCCHSLIRVIPAEAFLINDFIRQHFMNDRIQALEKTIRQYQHLVKGKTLNERVSIKDKTPCIFLQKDVCGIYPVRPLICRAWNSLDQSVCQSSFLSGNPLSEIDASPVRNYMFSTARDIFQAKDLQMGLKTGSYEIPGAILDCLQHGNSLERWCAGLPVFTEQENISRCLSIRTMGCDTP